MDLLLPLAVAVAGVTGTTALVGKFGFGFVEQDGVVFLTLFGLIVVGHFFLAVWVVTAGIAGAFLARYLSFRTGLVVELFVE